MLDPRLPAMAGVIYVSYLVFHNEPKCPSEPLGGAAREDSPIGRGPTHRR